VTKERRDQGGKGRKERRDTKRERALWVKEKQGENESKIRKEVSSLS
jgi:hypothetical protein